MTPRQKQLVQTTFKQLKPINGLAPNLFYARLFELDPSLRSMFRADLHEQGRKLMQMLSLAVKGLHRVEKLTPIARVLRAQGECGLQKHHYDTVGAAFLWMLEYGLGTAFTAEVREAWSNLYQLLAEAMEDVAMAT